MFRQFDTRDKKVRLVGIAVSQLNTVGGEQLSLFSDKSIKNEKLESLLLELKQKFGEAAVTRGTFLKKKDN